MGVRATCFLGGLGLSILSAAASAQDLDDETPLEELLFTEVRSATASQQAKTLRETPGVVSVITREEILALGARDLIDVLQLVPGFYFGSDVEGAIGVGFRGNWGHEGKVLLLMDGQEFNELLYSTLQFGNHFPVEHIQWIEVIRGPGSAVYGGNAELAVINVITRQATDLNGVSAAGFLGSWAGEGGRQNLSLAYGDTYNVLGGVHFSLSAFLGNSSRSTGTYQDIEESKFSLKENKLQPFHVNLGAERGGLKLRFLLEEYHTTTRDGYGPTLPASSDQDFLSMFLDAQHLARLSESLSLTSRLNFRRHVPWKETDEASDVYYDKTVDRVTGKVAATVQPIKKASVVVGAEAYYEAARLNSRKEINDRLREGEEIGFQALFGDKEEVSSNNVALYTEASLDHEIANVIGGLRFERHSVFGQSVVPRLGVTKLFKDLHLKLLYSQAFRAPGVENIYLGDDVRPERTQVIEIESGYRLSENLFVSINAFDVNIRKPIVYFFDGDNEAYVNQDKTGTQGVEAEVFYKHSRASLNLNYSYYRARDNQVELYEIPGNDELLLGAPGHKVTTRGSVRLVKELRLSPSAVFMSKRYGILDGDEENGIPAKLITAKEAVLLNLFLSYQNLWVKGLEAGAGVYNLFNVDAMYINPYRSNHAPIAGPPLEFVARVGYSYPL
ncbi:MAG: TonB-dependent receptor [Deltaproteobacteria bacterium]|nr:TonB-dependent receptor [Deltaproteobacteria bacterium]